MKVVFIYMMCEPQLRERPMAFYELRQYPIHPGKMDEWVAYMEEVIIPFQVSQGMVITGSYRSEDDGTTPWCAGWDLAATFQASCQSNLVSHSSAPVPISSLLSFSKRGSCLSVCFECFFGFAFCSAPVRLRLPVLLPLAARSAALPPLPTSLPAAAALPSPFVGC